MSTDERSGATGSVEGFLSDLPFLPDAFQSEAIDHVAAGESVVVTAPTGAGKTLIAEAGVYLTIARGLRAFYTTPIKALSNQKFGDFRRVYGDDRVGLLTGDNVISGDAPIVVMTTEVLRNMIYAGSRALDDLGLVILDEVHYLQDRARGQVWEEIIIHLDQEIPIVCLSATIANPEEFPGWVSVRRGGAQLVVETDRPVPLESLYLLKDRHGDGRYALLPVFGRDGARPNPEIEKLLKKGRGRQRRRFAPPTRLETVELTQAEGLLPAIYFIFSRAGCDQAADTVARAGLELTTPADRREIREIAGALVGHLPAGDLGVLGYGNFLANLEAGVSAHHAGLVPAFKETVETLFAAGLIKVVFATETLALGINMPARTVVLERLSKFTGESHELLQPGDYTQLTGRAGRRGIDTRGTAIVLHDRHVPFDRVAAIAAAGSHPLQSSFQPTYNMAVNLVANYDRSRAEDLLSASFAQFRSQERRAQLEERLAEREEERDLFRSNAECELGDVWALVAAVDEPDALSRVLRDFAQELRSGDVISLTGVDRDRWVVVARGWGGNPRLLLVSSAGELRRINADQLSPSSVVLGSLALPEPIRPRDTSYRRGLAKLFDGWQPSPQASFRPEAIGGDNAVASCPDLHAHLRWVRRADSTEREIRRLQRRIARGGEDLVGLFRSLLSLLDDWGYTSGWTLTQRGERLRFVYNEVDLLLAESAERKLLADLGPPELAALTSLFTYESRLADVDGGWPGGRVAERGDEVFSLWVELNEAERARRLPETRRPDSGFAAYVFDWAEGATLEDLFEDESSAGDFVRNCRQLLDLLRQLRDAYPQLADTARKAVKLIDRGIVAAGGRV